MSRTRYEPFSKINPVKSCPVELRNKTILILSPQSWGKMFVSKHHYALELAKRGNTVYFLNPPVGKEPALPENIVIRTSEHHPRLFIIDHRLSFPYNIKFHWIGLFHALMRPHVRHILRKIGQPVDIVWSFDLGNLYPFSLFPAGCFRLFHPVDEPLNQTAIDSAKGCGVILSVTQEILAKYNALPVARHFVNHGLAGYFLEPAETPRPADDAIRVGISGNFLRGDVDRKTLLTIIKKNPNVVFECWGSYTIRQSNIAGNDDEATHAFIAALQEQPNVILHGAVASQTLATSIRRMDAFLICYDIAKDQSGGTNYHKIMEYLSTGKVIVSNNVTTYKDRPDLLQMTSRRDDNRELPALFTKVISDLANYNSPSLQAQRISHAADNTYAAQINRIEKLLNS